jgi:hypothetical protein
MQRPASKRLFRSGAGIESRGYGGAPRREDAKYTEEPEFEFEAREASLPSRQEKVRASFSSSLARHSWRCWK